jgi:DNA-binding SARP family transcriptional activator/tetratricopeptide (TPR) repeat protein
VHYGHSMPIVTGGDLQMALLGPVGVAIDGINVPIVRAQRRAILAYLLLRANEFVSGSQLIDAMWGDEPPATAKSQVFAAVSELRRLLRRADDKLIISNSAGYRLSASDRTLDLLHFDELVRQADELLGSAALPAAAVRLRHAQQLWQGEPLGGITGAFAESARARLIERRLIAQENLHEVELALGRHEMIIPALRSIEEQYPYREKSVGQLMLALYRSGRGVEALDVFQLTRRRLVAELGVTPTPELQDLQQRILQNDPGLVVSRDVAVASGRTVTKTGTVGSRSAGSTLPRDLADFTGRDAELGALNRLSEASETSPGMVIVAGPAGVGKTALVVRWAASVLPNFPDGQLYVNLLGFGPQPMTTQQALGHLLYALGVEYRDIPVDVELAGSLFRSSFVDRRALIVLDNAATVEQVRPLLPGGANLVLVVSRHRLPGLVARDGARRLLLGPLTHTESMLLLRGVLGNEHVDREPQAAAALTDRCDHFPLAIRVAAARIADDPAGSIAGYLDHIARDGALAMLQVEADPESSFRTIFEHTYRALAADEQHLLAMAALVPGPGFGSSTVAAAAALTETRCNEVLAKLVDMCLVSRDADRYTMHDLVREFAGQQIPEPQRQDSVRRLVDHLRYTAFVAIRLQRPHQPFMATQPPPEDTTPVALTTRNEAFAWFQAEHATLVGTIRLASDNGLDRAVGDLAWTLAGFFEYLGHHQDRIDAQILAAASGQRLGDLRAYALALRGLGVALHAAGQHERSEEQMVAVAEVYRQIGDAVGEAHARFNIALAMTEQGRYSESIDQLAAAEVLYLAADRRGDLADARNSRAWAMAHLGRATEALDLGRVALDDLIALDLPRNTAAAWDTMAYIYAHTGDTDLADDAYTNAITLLDAVGDKPALAMTLERLGDLHAEHGSPTRADEAWRRALAVTITLPEADASRIIAKLESTPANASN